MIMSRNVSNSASSFACTQFAFISLNGNGRIDCWLFFALHFIFHSLSGITDWALCRTALHWKCPASTRRWADEAASAPKRRPSTWGAAAAADSSSKAVTTDANAIAAATDLGARIAVDASQRRWYQALQDDAFAAHRTHAERVLGRAEEALLEPAMLQQWCGRAGNACVRRALASLLKK
jgi:hypothetical protein